MNWQTHVPNIFGIGFNLIFIRFSHFFLCLLYLIWLYFNPCSYQMYSKWAFRYHQFYAIYFSPQKRLKHGRQNITLHWINGIIRIINVFYQIKCCFHTQNGCMNKKILQQLIPSQIPDRFSKLLCSTAVP